MSAIAMTLLEQLLALPVEDRAAVAQQLQASLEPLTPEDEAAEAAWQIELQRRLDSIADGSAQLLDGETMLAEIRALRAARSRE